jgi:enoyl-[acyl-carrier protein] reductase II
MVLTPDIIGSVELPLLRRAALQRGNGRGGVLPRRFGRTVGTRFILAEECTAHEEYKQRVIKAKDIDSKVTGRVTGHPVRLLRSPIVREMMKLEYEENGAEKLEKLGEGSLMRAVLHGDKDTGSFMAGQCACLLDKVQPAAEIIRELFDKASLARIRDDAFGTLLD